MKNFVTTLLLLGYILLVPFCFFGGMLMADAHTMNMANGAPHQMNDCGMLLGGCAQSMNVGVDSVAHHIGMYNAITQTPLVAFSMAMIVLVATILFALSVSHGWLSTPFPRISLRPSLRRVEKPQSNIQQSTLTWLSFLEASPNFA